MTKKELHAHEEVAVLIWLGLFFVAAGFYSLYLEARTFWSYREPQQVACTQEAKQCPDGSYVSRTGPNCEFKECSTLGVQHIHGLGLVKAGGGG